MLKIADVHETRMHSSRMHTAHLSVCLRMSLRGGRWFLSSFHRGPLLTEAPPNRNPLLTETPSLQRLPDRDPPLVETLIQTNAPLLVTETSGEGTWDSQAGNDIIQSFPHGQKDRCKNYYLSLNFVCGR